MCIMSMCILQTRTYCKGERNHMELNFEGLKMQKWNIPTDRAQIVDGKNGFVCPVITFTPRVMVIKMSKMAHFLYFLLMPAKNQSQFGQNIYVYLKDFIQLSQEMLWIVGFWGTISKTSNFEDTEFHYLFADSAIFLYFYPRYLTNGNSKTYEPYHFLKELKKIF